MRRPLEQKSEPSKFSDPGFRITGYLHEVLVECPNCGECAVVRCSAGYTDESRRRWEWRMVCHGCGQFADWTDGLKDTQGPFQPQLVTGRELVLWLRTRVRGRPLWAFNAQHLRDVRGYIYAKHRGRGRDGLGGQSSRSMIATLPRWIVSAKNREDVLRGLSRLSNRVPEILREPPTTPAASM